MGLFSGKFFEGVTLGKVLDAGSSVFGSKAKNEPAYQAEVQKSSTFAQKEGSNTMLYMGLAGVGLFMMMFMMKR